MEWDDATRERLEVALNESDVVGVRLDPARAYVDVLRRSARDSDRDVHR
jgi:hypothetical protein